MDDIKAECVFNGQVHVKEEEDDIKEEPEWEEHAGVHGISAAAARAGLYANHEVKDELVLGPEGPQPADIAFTLYACQASHSNANVHMKKETYICDICNKRFALKTRLMEHVVIHIDQEPEQEEIRVANSAALAATAREHPALRDCVVRLERLEVVDLEAGRDERLASRAGRDTDVEKEIHGNVDISTEEETYICDTCEKQFPMKSQLVDHVMIHIQRHESRRGVAGNAALAATAREHPALRHGVVSDLEAGRDERLASRAGRDTDVEKEIHGNVDISTEEETYICDTCEKRFPLKSQLVDHVMIHIQRQESRRGVAGNARGGRGEGREPTRAQDWRHACLICRKHFPTPSQLKTHERIHTGARPFSCGTCNKKFTREDNLKTHERIHTGVRPFSCGICKKKFTREDNLKTHERIHTGERPFSCGICKQKFTQVGHLKRHERIHTGGRPFSCGICKQKFTESGSLKKHERTHTGERPFSCGTCNKKFTRVDNLKTHERIHTGERPFSCGICKQKFTQLGYLKIHERTHTGERPFSCGICKQKFTESGSLKKHERTHTGERPFSCGTCNKKFTRVDSLKAHERIHTGERPFSCGICKQKFTQLRYLKIHERTHTGE